VKWPVVLVAVAGCGPIGTIHERTAPRRIEVTKQAAPTRLVIAARLANDDSIELVAKHATELRITRVVHYGAASFEIRRSTPFIKLVEMPIGLAILVMAGPLAWQAPYQTRDTRTHRTEWHTNMGFALVSPFQSVLQTRIRANPAADAAVFRDPAMVRGYEVRLPVPNLVASYRLLDESERVIATGTVTTDAFGRARIPDPGGAVAVEISAGATTTIVPVLPPEAP
jgi:hypothetical protein